VWEEGHEEAWFLMSDQPAWRARITLSRWRTRIESTVHDMKRRGWQWESSYVRQLDRVERMVVCLAVRRVRHLAASCVQRGRRPRADWHDRRETGLVHLGRLS
jgi:hypothetical protein